MTNTQHEGEGRVSDERLAEMIEDARFYIGANGYDPSPEGVIAVVTELQAYRRAQPAPAMAGDWVMVPREPTREMWAAMGNAAVNTLGLHHDKTATAIYSAAIAAAPTPPATQPVSGVSDMGNTISKLEWSTERQSGFLIFVGRGLGIKYEAAIKVFSPGWIVALNGVEVVFDREDADEETAKAAAQADYERRILSALSHPAAVVTDDNTLEALKMAKRLIDEALPKFDWGKSALDANAIQLLNETPGVVNAALQAALEGK